MCVATTDSLAGLPALGRKRYRESLQGATARSQGGSRVEVGASGTPGFALTAQSGGFIPNTARGARCEPPPGTSCSLSRLSTALFNKGNSYAERRAVGTPIQMAVVRREAESDGRARRRERWRRRSARHGGWISDQGPSSFEDLMIERRIVWAPVSVGKR